MLEIQGLWLSGPIGGTTVCKSEENWTSDCLNQADKHKSRHIFDYTFKVMESSTTRYFPDIIDDKGRENS
ncbi:hypothetical protein [Candidatus Nitrosocosmicus arcticus]|uniref:Uncharacterized protein n=1 Tax=Candidatus Nitrosocosmicus arcticus TaxID=2035267 RepID=A0A557SU76_9ARCH|nr:hypothetical protein [Candidatus Nitrosocosmicus arcticus]TVP40157.1 hypothetical protein NARC_90063 [Candidatus Nitrosocosmicus arcticus]